MTESLETYKIANGSCAFDLEKEVNYWLERGWKLYGPMTLDVRHIPKTNPDGTRNRTTVGARQGNDKVTLYQPLIKGMP